MDALSAIARFRQDLIKGRLCIGASVGFSDPLVSDALADSVDFIWIDLEHSAMSPEALAGHLLAARSRNIPALVRVAGGAAPFTKPVLDAGADGVIVPQVRTADEVTEVVRECRYPPIGRRGYGPRVPSNYGRQGGREYTEHANENLFVAVQIETAEAIESLDAIVAVPGLDSLVIGPWDLSSALGVLGDVEHPKVVSAIEMIIKKAHAAGLFVGAGMGPDPEYACTMARRGVQWLQVGGDYDYLVNEAERIKSFIKSQFAEPAAR